MPHFFHIWRYAVKNLKTIEEKVRAVLEQDEDARNDDMTLYLRVCNAYVKGAGTLPLETIMLQYRLLCLPNFESVGRTRRKLQAECPELLGSLEARKCRSAQENAYRQYAKE